MDNNQEIAKIFKALCDENRIAVLKLLRGGEKCACELYDLLPITKPTISHHMKILVESGIVLARKEGKWTHYSLKEDGIQNAQEILGILLAVEEAEQGKGGCACK